MSQILNVIRSDDGQFEITDQRSNVVEGPFDTNAAAWKALDRLDNEASRPDKPRSRKKILWVNPRRTQRRLAARNGSSKSDRTSR